MSDQNTSIENADMNADLGDESSPEAIASEGSDESTGDTGNEESKKPLVPEAPLNAVKNGAIGVMGTTVGGYVGTEVAKEVAAEALQEATRVAAQGAEAAVGKVTDIPVIGGALEGAAKAGITTAADGANVAEIAGETIKGGIKGAGNDIGAIATNATNGVRGGMLAASDGVMAVGTGIKSMASSAITGIQSAGASFAGWVSSVWATATASVATAVVSGVTVIGLLTGGVGAAYSIYQETSIRRIGTLVDTCAEASKTEYITIEGSELFYAFQIYSVMTAAGGSRQETAGMLGNFSAESGIDPTSVETVYNEPYQIGAVKQAIIAADFNPNSNPNFPNHGDRFPLIKRLGIGLGQWTDINDGTEGGRNTNLRTFAESIDKDWYTVDAQMAFLLHENRSNIRNAYIGSGMSLDAATTWFMSKWEGINDGTYGKRAEAGARLLTELEMMQEDRVYGESILTLASINVEEGAINAKQKALYGCVEQRKLFVDNESIAVAAATYAWPTREQSMGNNGTDLYQRVARLTGIPMPWMSCDRGVATAVRWSGADDNFPPGNTLAQRVYMDANPDRWEKVGTYPGTLEEIDLQPGDILMNDPQHVVLYAGYDAVQKAHPGVDANLVQVSASLGTRSPGLNLLLYGGSGTSYRVYRNIKQEENSKYKDMPIQIDSY